MGPKQGKYKEIEVGEYKSDQPFTIVFAYPEDGPLVIKGSEKDTLEYVKDNLGVCHFQVTYWCKGKTLEDWRVNSDKWRITTQIKKGRKYHVFEFNRKQILEFRTIPKKHLLFLHTTENGKHS